MLVTKSMIRFLLVSWTHVAAVIAALQGDFDGDGLADDTELLLASRFMPRFHFHQEERFFPVAVELYLAQTQLYYQRNPSAPFCHFNWHNEYMNFGLPVLSVSEHGDVCVNAPGTQLPRLRRTAEERGCDYRTLACDLHNNTRHNVIECKSASTRTHETFFLHAGRALPFAFNASAPVYTHVHLTPEGHVVLQYWLFYAFNGALDDLLMAGAHEADWEHVSLMLDSTRQHVQAVYMAAHSHQGSWLSPGEFQITDGTHVDVFVALHSHACYETPGTKARFHDTVIYSFLKDRCSDRGYVWQPTEVVNMGEREAPLVSWAYFNGYWGSKKTVYSFIPLPVEIGSPPRGPMHQLDYWLWN